jgi:hypothetical protein
MNSTENRLLTVPLGSEAHQLARQFAVEQANPQKGKRVYLNTLSVYAVHSYLKWFEIETDLLQSDCCNPQLRSVFDLADLVIPNVGKLECRPVLPGQTAFPLPLEVTENRIGYLAVQFSDRLDSVQLLGFAPAFTTEPPEQLQLSDLQPVENILDYLVPQTAPATSSSLHGDSVNLRQWLQNIFEPAWQPIENLLNLSQRNQAYAFMAATDSTIIRRAKLIDLGMHLRGQTVTLLVSLMPETDELTEIRVQLYPVQGARYLPSNIKLALLAQSGRVIREVSSRSEDYCIQLDPFKYRMGRSFCIRVALDDLSVTEDIYTI